MASRICPRRNASVINPHMRPDLLSRSSTSVDGHPLRHLAERHVAVVFRGFVLVRLAILVRNMPLLQV